MEETIEIKVSHSERMFGLSLVCKINKISFHTYITKIGAVAADTLYKSQNKNLVFNYTDHYHISLYVIVRFSCKPCTDLLAIVINNQTIGFYF